MDKSDWTTEMPTEAGDYYWLPVGFTDLDPPELLRVELDVTDAENPRLFVLEFGVDDDAPIEDYTPGYWAPVDDHPPLPLHHAKSDLQKFAEERGLPDPEYCGDSGC